MKLPHDELLEPGHCVSNNLHQTARAISRIYGEVMRPSGLQRSQFVILGYLVRRGSMNLSQLAQALYMERTTLTRNLRPLEKQGLVIRVASETDARSREVRVTGPGRDKFEKSVALWREAQRRVLDAYGADNWRTMETSLRKLRDISPDISS